ncbi:MAG TPA: hypothetical protein PK020_03940 [Ilumatobacteraceae bacterium]|nr:hypothetical protein [Ilumatobacteraceae bacterium]
MEHVLDTLTRQRVSGDRAEVDAELMLHCQAGTAAVVQVLPPCYVCGEAARYDGPASKEANVAWGNMCTAHYLEQSTGRLGLGEGQYLFKADEISSELLEALESAVEYWSSWTN